MRSALRIVSGLVSVLGFVTALPQASVTLWEFEPALGSVIGTEWAEPIGTASDGSVTTFIVADVVTLIGLTLVGSETITSTAAVTGIETVMVSASGWAETGTSSGTSLGGAIDCFFTSSSSGECVREEVLDDGSTSTQTITGSGLASVLAISTGILPTATPATTAGFSQMTISSIPTPTPPPTSAVSPTTSSNAALSMHMMNSKRSWNMGALAVVGGIVLGVTTLL